MPAIDDEVLAHALGVTVEQLTDFPEFALVFARELIPYCIARP